MASESSSSPPAAMAEGRPVGYRSKHLHDAIMKFLVNKRERTISGVHISNFNETEFVKGGYLRTRHNGRGAPALAPDGTVMTSVAGSHHNSHIVLNGGNHSLLAGDWSIENYQAKSDHPGYEEWLSKIKWTNSDALRSGIPLTSINATMTTAAKSVQQTSNRPDKNTDDLKEEKEESPQPGTDDFTNQGQERVISPRSVTPQKAPSGQTPFEYATLPATYSEITTSNPTTPGPRLEADHSDNASSEPRIPERTITEPSVAEQSILEVEHSERAASEPKIPEPSIAELFAELATSEYVFPEPAIPQPATPDLSVSKPATSEPKKLEIPETPPPPSRHSMHSEAHMSRERTPTIPPDSGGITHNHATMSTKRPTSNSSPAFQPASTSNQTISSRTPPPTPVSNGSLKRKTTEPLDRLITFYVGDGNEEDAETFIFSENNGPVYDISEKPRLFEAMLHWIDKRKVMRKSYFAPYDLESYYLDLYLAAVNYVLPGLSNAIIDKLHAWHSTGTVRLQMIGKVYEMTQPKDGLRRFYFSCMMALSTEEFEATPMEQPAVIIDLFAVKKATWDGMKAKEAYHDA
ncbi:hypothetical protein V493_06036 [Pseudogymnoascus sp. VKM F-4281 (FW-2241)]|nr:hypothetical protein V493_06036 [Pseudogymnoascus sp. VKM F-4281 (FW-2241)]